MICGRIFVRNFHRSICKNNAIFPKLLITDDTNVYNSNDEVPSLAAYEAARIKALAGGGPKGSAKHVQTNKKLLARDRITRLLDPGTELFELSLLAGLGMEYGDVPNGGTIIGIGSVNGQLCVVQANDATVKGGTIFPITLKKQLRAQEIALANALPCIYVIDSGGAFLPLQADIFNPGGRTFYNQAIMSARGIPQLALVCGSCTAGGAYIPTMADESVIVRGIGHVFLGGPPLVKAALGEQVSAEQLGGADLHCKISGCTDHLADNEEEAFKMMRSIVASLNLSSPEPPHQPSLPPLLPPSSLSNLPQHPSAKSLLAGIVDDGRFQEFKASYGSPGTLDFSRAGFAHIEGRLVGLLVISGPVSKKDAIKGCHFVQLCSQRDVPIVVLTNCGRREVETDQENLPKDHEVTSVIRAHAQLMTTLACSGSPVVTIAIGPNDDDSAFVAAPSTVGPRFAFAWPQASPPVPGLSKPELMVQMALSSHPDMEEDRISELRSRLQRERTSTHAASRVWIDGIVLPEDTRSVLSHCLKIFDQAKLNKQLFKKREAMTISNLKF